MKSPIGLSLGKSDENHENKGGVFSDDLGVKEHRHFKKQNSQKKRYTSVVALVSPLP